MKSPNKEPNLLTCFQENGSGTPRSNTSSPVQDFELFEDETGLLGDLNDDDPDEGEGEELFGDNMEK